VSTAQATQPVKSGAAGAAIFPGSDSRKFNYFEPKGRKATHYEDMTVDVQPDPDRYLLQDWIISFPDGTPTYSKTWTKALSSDWHKFRAVDQEWERTHYQRQSTICGMVQGVIENARKSGAPKRFDKAWVKVLQDHLGAYKHAEFGLGTSMMQAQRYGYTQMINTAILTNSSYKMRFAQDLTIYLAEIGLDMSRFPTPAHLASWAKLCPRTIQSGPITRGGRTGKGNPYLKGVLGDAATAAAKTNTFLGERYRRIVKRRGKLKALVAVARSLLVVVWHLLADPAARFYDLGADYHTNRIVTQRRVRNHIAQLTALGYRVTLEPAA